MIRYALLALLLAAPVASAHYHMLLPGKHSVKAGEEVTFSHQFGHPFEHELFDTAEPQAVYVIHPDGTKEDIKKGLKKVAADGPEGKKVTGYTFAFTPPKRGDYTVVAVSPEVKAEGQKLHLKDVAKVVLHVQTQNGWDNTAVDAKTAPFDLQPLTRPYGLTAGSAFHVDVLDAEGKPVRRAPVEVEKYNPTAPKALPADEFVTRTHRTSRTGTAVVTLTEAGWWGVTAVKADDKAEHRCTLWVYVDAAAE
jgi:uncharacterized GH25 family protein